ncbi:MAG: hypothetical protein JXA01_02970 [Dehalococcoidia bacterium]|nr:hypothetical protein [Dehalococcoidia bacterium]
MVTDSALYISQLKTVSANSGSNAYVRKWAQLWLDEIEFQVGLTSRSRETLTRLNVCSYIEPEQATALSLPFNHHAASQPAG